ncbi:MAG TPA: hypothetical protein V6C81_01030 [Planktothrix sp.]|jgi:hypothetical protein
MYEVPEGSIKIQKQPRYYAFTKAANTVVYFSLLYLSFRFFTHHLDVQVSTGCVLLSACWLIFTRIKLDHLLQTYCDFLSRLELTLPIVVGLGLSSVSLIAHTRPFYDCASAAEVVGWLYIYALYKHNQIKYKKQGYGPVPKDAAVDLPVAVMRAGDLLLTSGNIAKELHDSVGHAETVIKMPDGRTMLFSSYMDKGCRLHPVADLTVHDKKRHYIGLHLREQWNKEQSDRAAQLAQEMEATNKKWAAEENVRVAKRIDWMPLPTSLKDRLKKLFHASGYDWFGTFMGRVADNRWTCIGAAVALYHKMGVETNAYGTGLLGVGTTLFDPILPVRFLADDAFDLIKQSEVTESARSSIEA